MQDTAVYDPPNFAFSNGAHVCEVEVDPDTGSRTIVGYWAVDDVGTVINPMIVEGQIQGGGRAGPRPGAARALRTMTTAASSSPARSWTTRCRAPTICPHIVSEFDESQPCTHNPLGAKGCGEAGSIGAPAAVVNAVLDALSPLGVTAIDMPLTPERVWKRSRWRAREP